MVSDQHLALHQREKIDRLADQFEREFKAGSNPRIEDYLQRQPVLRQHLLRELMTLEVELRQAAGDRLSPSDYQQRFPEDRSIVAEVLSPELARTVDYQRNTDDDGEQRQPEQLGRYAIRGVLGRGGFGVVYLAHDPQLDRLVALKVPRRKRFQTPEQVARFVEEARTAANLKHASLVAVYDVQEHDGLPYIVQEYIEGQNLGDWSAANQPSFEQIARVLVGVAEALGYVHQQGLTHCDLKPANVLMDTSGHPHVADFGLAVHESVQALRKGEVFGTPAMMAPEQVRGESHRLDGRTDIWAMGVMLYKLLVGRRPFAAESREELYAEIQAHDPKPPRQIDRQVPRELERICLKCLAKQRTERYNTTDDLREDLLAWLGEESSTESPRSTTAAIAAQPDSSSGSKPPVKIIPKGLRSFDAEDADFFLELLPGPRDRDGLPDSIRFWKSRIEETGPDTTFPVGLIYGPSGCGKSSFVKAGLLPKLCEDVLPIYVEATASDTEVRILKKLGRHFSRLNAGNDPLPEVFAELRLTGAGRSRKVLLVLDQFEQWLHAHGGEDSSQLIDALRQCDGRRLQSIVLVRDDFWMAATRFMRQLEIRLLEAVNSGSVDLFDQDHARRVLAAFGRAYGKLSEELTAGQTTFLDQSVKGLAQEGKVVCVRLSLLADMMKGRPWTPAVLQHAGGTEGIGVTFLEETFSASTAPPEHRLHQKAARAVLKALLPEAGTDIKGHMRSSETLLDASGYAGRPQEFVELIRILDSEIRLITPTDPEGLDSESDSRPEIDSGQKYYQLTHDYLVPSLRDWLTRKQRETRRGRAEMRLAELAAAWNAKPENRHLPNVFEWLNIRWLTAPKEWSAAQERMMGRAARVHATLWGSVLVLLLLAGIALQQYVALRDRQSEELARQNAIKMTETAVDALQAGTGAAIPFLLEKLDSLPRPLVQEELRSSLTEATGQQKLSLAYGLAHFGQVEVDAVVAGIDRDTQPSEVSHVVTALETAKDRALAELASVAASASSEQNWQTKARLAVVGMYLGDLSIAAEMLKAEPDDLPRQEPESPLAKLRKLLAEIEQLPSEQQKSPRVRMDRARALYYLDRPQDALADLRELVGGESAFPQALLLHALCLAREGSAEQAEAAVKKLESATKIRRAYAARARILTEAWLGNIEEANRQFEELVTEDADNATTQYNAACSAAQLVRVHGDADEAERTRLTRRAVGLLRRAFKELGFKPSSRIRNPHLAPLYGDAEFKSLLFEVDPPSQPWDPVQRTEFIEEFSKWCGDVQALAAILQDTDKPDIRSGICLGIGTVEGADTRAREAWEPVLARWYENEADPGTHSAAGWALRQWGLKLPTVEPTQGPPAEHGWWRSRLGLTMLRIPAGRVGGGNNTIVVDNHFWLSDREISIALFKQFMSEAEPAERPDDWKGAYTFDDTINDFHPVQKVSWEDAVMFCNWLSRQHGFAECYKVEPLDKAKTGFVRQKYTVTLIHDDGFRLPTDDEWEYACRARTTTNYSCGDDNEQLRQYAVFGRPKTEVCGSMLCNPWGLFDMHGNVREWCWDLNGGSHRVVRGGSWYSTAWDCQSSDRVRFSPTYRSSSLGFRVARGLWSGQARSGAESGGR